MAAKSKSSSNGPAFAGYLLFALFWNGLIGVFDGVLITQKLNELDARDRFVQVDATVTSSEVAVDSTSDGTTYRPSVTYTYSRDGAEYTSDRHSFSSWGSSDSGPARAVVAEFPEGSRVTAYVDPDEPESAVLSVDGSSFPFFVVIFLIPFHCVGFWLVRQAWRAWRGKSLSGTRNADLRRRFVQVDNPDRLVVQRPRVSPGDMFLFAFGGASFAAIFAILIPFGFEGAGAFVVPTLIGCAAVGAAAAVWKHHRNRRPEDFLHVDRRLGLFSFPADTEGESLDGVEGLTVESEKTNVTVNDERLFDHEIFAVVSEERLPMFKFRGRRGEGDALRELLEDLVL